MSKPLFLAITRSTHFITRGASYSVSKAGLLLLVVLVLVLGNPLAHGQSVVFNYVADEDFSGVHKIGKDNVVTGFWQKEVEDGNKTFVIKFLSYGLSERNGLTFSFPESTYLNAWSVHGEILLCCFMDFTHRQATYLTFSNDGSLLGRKTESGLRLSIWNGREYHPQTLVGEPGFFYILKPFKGKQFGYTVEKVNKNLATSWSRNYLPKKGYAKVLGLAANNQLVYLLQEHKKRPNAKQVLYEFVLLGSTRGAFIGASPLATNNLWFQPAQSLLTSDGLVLVGNCAPNKKSVNNLDESKACYCNINKSGEVTNVNLLNALPDAPYHFLELFTDQKGRTSYFATKLSQAENKLKWEKIYSGSWSGTTDTSSVVTVNFGGQLATQLRGYRLGLFLDQQDIYTSLGKEKEESLLKFGMGISNHKALYLQRQMPTEMTTELLTVSSEHSFTSFGGLPLPGTEGKLIYALSDGKLRLSISKPNKENIDNK